MAKTSALTVKQEKFCQIYAATGNATKAFKEAGYAWKSEGAAIKNASLLLHKNSNVKERLRELAEESKNEAICDIQEMHTILSKIIREELDEEQLMTIGVGEGYSEVVSKRKKAAMKDRLKAIELLAKMQGGFVDKVEVSGAAKVVFVDDLDE